MKTPRCRDCGHPVYRRPVAERADGSPVVKWARRRGVKGAAICTVTKAVGHMPEARRW